MLAEQEVYFAFPFRVSGESQRLFNELMRQFPRCIFMRSTMRLDMPTAECSEAHLFEKTAPEFPILKKSWFLFARLRTATLGVTLFSLLK